MGVLPAERFCCSAGRTVLSFCWQNGSVVLPAERFCRSAGRTDGPQSAPYIYRWLKKGMELISDGQNGSVVLPAERFCRSASRTDGPQSAPYIYRWLKMGWKQI